VVKARTDRVTDGRGAPPGRTTVRPARHDNSGPREQDQRLPDAAPPIGDQERVQIEQVRQEATAAATDVRGHHLLHTYARLMPANPRMIKRIANALGMLQAVRRHVQHTEDDDAMARAAILLVRFPEHAARLRHDDLLNDTDPCWDLPAARDVLGMRSLESLARCLGRADPPTANKILTVNGSADAGSAPQSPDPA
jgi:hypothetical protein